MGVAKALMELEAFLRRIRSAQPVLQQLDPDVVDFFSLGLDIYLQENWKDQANAIVLMDAAPIIVPSKGSMTVV